MHPGQARDTASHGPCLVGCPSDARMLSAGEAIRPQDEDEEQRQLEYPLPS